MSCLSIAHDNLLYTEPQARGGAHHKSLAHHGHANNNSHLAEHSVSVSTTICKAKRALSCLFAMLLPTAIQSALLSRVYHF